MTALPDIPEVNTSGEGTATAVEHENSKWYVIHTYSGYEKKVKKNLEHRIDSMGMKDKIFEVVETIHKQGVTVLLVEQNASRALGIADRGYVMESGEVTMNGPADALLNDPKVRAAYLGE